MHVRLGSQKVDMEHDKHYVSGIEPLKINFDQLGSFNDFMFSLDTCVLCNTGESLQLAIKNYLNGYLLQECNGILNQADVHLGTLAKMVRKGTLFTSEKTLDEMQKQSFEYMAVLDCLKYFSLDCKNTRTHRYLESIESNYKYIIDNLKSYSLESMGAEDLVQEYKWSPYFTKKYAIKLWCI